MKSQNKIRKAVLPMAGLGTRFRPITHVIAKEFLPILNKPVFHYIVDEVLAAGCEEIICVMRPGREFATNYARLAELPIKITVAWQDEALGLGHAVACAEEAVANEPFFVVLPDVIIDAATPVCAQLQKIYNPERAGAAIAVKARAREVIHTYGVVDVHNRDGSTFDIKQLIEKPASEVAPSNLTIVGRYLLPPSIFTTLKNTKPGTLGEIQLTDALQEVANKEGLLGLEYEEFATFDAGQPHGWLEANNYFAKKAGILS